MLQIEGVDYKGFGNIYKFIMTDSDLKIGAKALYAYLCSYTGKGNSAYPKRDKILYDLQICKTAYYKYLNQLVEDGYIKVERADKYPFKNIYTIVSRPLKLKTVQPDIKEQKQLVSGGIKAFGYGSIPKAVMIDRRLSCASKALYAYLCSFAGNGTCAFPKCKDILYHLNISINTLNSYMRELIGCNYITVEQQHDKGRFDRNIYYINDLPDEEIGQAEIERRMDYQQQKWQKIQDRKQGLVNLPTLSKSATIKVTKREKSEVNTQEKTQRKQEEKDMFERDIFERDSYEQFIKDNIEYDILKAEKDAEYLDLIVDVMVDAVTSKKNSLRVNQQDMPTEAVKSRLLKLDSEHVRYVQLCLSETTTMPKNLRAYLLTTLYNASTGIDAYYTMRVKHDFNENS